MQMKQFDHRHTAKRSAHTQSKPASASLFKVLSPLVSETKFLLQTPNGLLKISEEQKKCFIAGILLLLENFPGYFSLLYFKPILEEQLVLEFFFI